MKRSIGLELEFILHNKTGVVFPGKKGFGIDEFPLLAEIRPEYGTTPNETLSNFYKVYLDFQDKVEKNNLTINEQGESLISLELYKEAIRSLGSKQVPESRNIYGTDILDLSDTQYEDGKLTGHYLTAGLHIHFGAIHEVSKEFLITPTEYSYYPVDLPLNMGEGLKTKLDLYRREKNIIENKKEKITAYANIITKPVLEYIIKRLDTELLPLYLEDYLKKRKYRQKGFYEVKQDGRFEYRSMPCNKKVLDDIRLIVNKSYEILYDATENLS